MKLRPPLFTGEPDAVASLCLTFAAADAGAGAARGAEVELVPGGAAVAVTSANKAAYVEAMFKRAMLDAISGSLGALLRGFYEVSCRSARSRRRG